MTKTLEEKVDMILDLLVDLMDGNFAYSLREDLREDGFDNLQEE